LTINFLPISSQVSSAVFGRRLTDQKGATLAKDFGAVRMVAISKAIARAELRRQEYPE